MSPSLPLPLLLRTAPGVARALVDGVGRVGDQARWGLGMALAAHARVTGAVDVEEVSQRVAARRSPHVRAHPVTGDRVQPASMGVGAFYVRRYRVRIAGAELGPHELMDRLKADLNIVVPRTMVRFRRLSRPRETDMRVDDEYAVDLFGPWVCRVRVVESRPASFRLATLHGHMEAGEIRFSCRRSDDLTVFAIESQARCGDRIFALLYDHLFVAREMQAHLWSSVCIRTAAVAGGRVRGPVEVLTRRHETGLAGR